ncbi:MAG: helix-turn-helix transcriptional regulator [Rickettsiaceae bacterium]|nr:helix-turn-helix transcriptional regulator [Rickettsiaceae bacterium]
MKEGTISNKKGKVDYIDQHVGRKLQLRRQVLGLSRQELASAVNVSVQQIQKYEKATNRISSGKLYSLANLLFVPLEFFFNDLGGKTQKIGLLHDEKATYEVDSQNTSEIQNLENELEKLNLVVATIKDADARKKIYDLALALASKKN